MSIPVQSPVSIQIPGTWVVTCFGNIQANDVQQVQVTDLSGKVICTATGQGGTGGQPVALTFKESASTFFYFPVPGTSPKLQTYTVSVTDMTTGGPQLIMQDQWSLSLGATVYGTVYVFACDDQSGSVDYNDCIFYMQACAQPG